MAPVLVLPGAIGLGEHCRGVLFETAGGIRRGPWADLIGRATITRTTIAFTGTRGAGWTDSWAAVSCPSVTQRNIQMGKTKDIREAVEAELAFDPLVDAIPITPGGLGWPK
jgi:hypothetical protein